MRLTYIYHSGFAIEAEDFTIIIDYFEDSLGKEHGVVHDRLLYRTQKLYVLCTHGHSDHYNSKILKWKEIRNDITYIFSKDIEQKASKFLGINFIDKDEVFKDDLLEVRAYGSTDLGVSFKITYKDMVLFHAGDLNNWHWNEESTEKEISEAENFYARELEHLAISTPSINLAMFPVDPRLGKDYMLGAEQFIKRIPVKLFVSMHFDGEYEKAKKIEDFAEKHNTRVFTPSFRGEVLENIEEIIK